MTTTKMWITGLCAFAFALAGGSLTAFAEETADQGNAAATRLEKRQAKLEELKKLKQENPAEFERLMKERKAKIKEKLEELKEKDPEKYQEMKERITHRRKEYLKKLRREDPDKFHEIMENRAEKLRELKANDPKKYEEFIKKHPRLADQGVRDYGRGIGKGKGQGSVNRTGGPRGRNND